MLYSVSTSPTLPQPLGSTERRPPCFLGLQREQKLEEKVEVLMAMNQVTWRADREDLGAKIAHRMKVDMAALSVLFSVMEGAGITMNLSLQKHITPGSTLSNRRPTHWRRPWATEGNRSNQCESRDFLPPVTSKRLFHVTSAIPLILPPSRTMRGTKPRKERSGVKEKIKTPSHSWKLNYNMANS